MRGRLLWLWNRFRAMPPPEWGRRVESAARLSLVYLNRKRLRPGVDQPETPELTFKGDELDDVPPDRLEELDLFGVKVDLTGEIDWHRDPLSGRRFPLGPSPTLDHRDADRYGDVKYVWELNRLQHLLWLGLAARGSSGSEMERELARRIDSWRAANPVLRGVNWKSGLELGMRLLGWSQLLFVLPPARARDLYRRHLRDTLYQHQFLVHRFPSRHSSANNHRVGEAAGLYVSTTLWPTVAAALRWRRKAKRWLVETMAAQVSGDGVSRELSVEYHLFVTELFLCAGALGTVVGDPFPDDYWRRLRAMLDFLDSIRDRAGHLPRFGDGDEATALATRLNVEGRLERLRRLAGRTEERSAADDRLLLWGLDSRRLPLEPRRQPRMTGIDSFSEAGYHVLVRHRGEDDELLAVFDTGSLGMEPLYAHGHADALSFWLSVCGKLFLTDPGTFSYYTQPGWRDYFRSTAAHNTVGVDRRDQSEVAGRFLWRDAARSTLVDVGEDRQTHWVTASHDGYRRLASPVSHQRTLRLAKESPSLTVLDQVDGQGRHRIEIRFHFAPECRVDRLGERAFRAVSGERRILLSMDGRLDARLYHGSEEPRAGWVSPRFGIRVPSFTVVGITELTVPLELRTEITVETDARV